MPVVCAIRSRCVLFGLAQALAKVIVIQATDEWTTLYDLLWSFHCSSTDTILLSIYTTVPQLNPGAWVGEYGRLGVLRYKFLPKQSRLFDDDAHWRGGGKTLLSVTHAIRAVKPGPLLQHTNNFCQKAIFISLWLGYAPLLRLFVSCSDNVEMSENPESGRGHGKVSLLIRCLRIMGFG